MENIRKQILTLINTHGKSASKMTEALCYIGDGKMEVGITKIAKYFEKIGVIKGSVGTLTIVGLTLAIKKFVYDKIKSNKIVGEEILDGLEKVMLCDENAIDNELGNEGVSIDKGLSSLADQTIGDTIQS